MSVSAKRAPILREGAVLDDRYTLITRLGEGGQGSVWKAFDRNTGEDRALKIAALDDSDPEAANRARREAEVVKDARHPALVACHSLFQIPSADLLVLVFELVRATSLAEALADPRFERSHKLAALRHIAGAIAYLHGIGVVHRDLKPANVLVTDVFWEDPAAPSALKLIDLGIASPRRALDDATIAGMFGTPPYMAPELFRGADVEAQRSPGRDVFAIGVIGWEMLEGGHPTGLDRKAGMAAYRTTYERLRRSRDPWPPRALAGRWGSILAACLALDPAERPADGNAILSLLDGAPRAGSDNPKGAPRGGVASPKEPRDRVRTDPHAAPEEAAPVPTVSPAMPLSPEAAPSPGAVHTELAPASSLPRSPSVDRTTPMVPQAVTAPQSRPSSPDIEPTAPRPVERRPSRAEPESDSGLKWVVALAVVSCALAVGAFAWGLLGGTDSRPASPSGPSATLPPPSSSPAPAVSPTGLPTSTDGGSTAGTAATATPLVVCCADKKGTCKSGRACTAPPDCTKDVPAREFVLRVVKVSRRTDIYTRWENLADRRAYPDSTVCVSAHGESDCATMKSIASADGGTVKGLRVSTFDIRDKGLDLVVKGQRGSPDIRASLEPTGRLQSTALCKNLVLEDKDSKVQLAAYLDDPPPDSSNTHPTTPLPTSQPTP